jgi:hypothetical protein
VKCELKTFASKPALCYRSHDNGKNFLPGEMSYYAHTAEDETGKPLPESCGHWQSLRTHLRNVAELAGNFAAPFVLARLLLDL